MKKHKLTLHYSVQNGGDGSAYPKFMTSEKLAKWDQEQMEEGWGESCTGSITLESDSPIRTDKDVVSPEGYLVELIDGYSTETKLAKFLTDFFPNGKPIFTVKTRRTNNDNYLYNDVYVGDQKVATEFKDIKESGDKFVAKLNE